MTLSSQSVWAMRKNLPQEKQRNKRKPGRREGEGEEGRGEDGGGGKEEGKGREILEVRKES